MKLFPLSVRMSQLAPVLLVLLSAALAIGAYLQALNYPFLIDDPIYISDNHKLAMLAPAELWRLFSEPYNSAHEFLPLRDFSYWLDMRLFGQNPSAFRLHNMLLYLLCLPLVYAVTSGLWKYFRTTDAASAPLAAAAVTALFALHPALVESVIWISGRKYVLPDLFSMLAFWLAINTKREHGLSPLYASATLLALAAVMFSKSSYVAVAPVIALLWVFFWRDLPEQNRRRLQLLWPLAILLLAAILMRLFIVHNNGYDGIPFYFGSEAISRSLGILGWLARLAISPENRHFFYPLFEDAHLTAMTILGGVVLISAVAGMVMLVRRRSLEWFALLVFLLLCLPYMQLMPHKLPSLVSDRYLALAVWPAMLLLVALTWRLQPVPRAVLLLALALPLSFQTVERVRDWRSFDALVEPDLQAQPGYYMPALYKVVMVQLPQGLYREASATASSITVPEFRDIALKLVDADYAVRMGAVAAGNPQETMNLLTELSRELRQPPLAASWNSPMNLFWGKALDVLAMDWDILAGHFPDNAVVRYNAALYRLSAYRYENTVAHLRFVTESGQLPEAARGTAFKYLGVAMLNDGKIAEAETPLLAALEQSPPDFRAYCVLAKVYRQTGRFEAAARAEVECHNHASSEKNGNERTAP